MHHHSTRIMSWLLLLLAAMACATGAEVRGATETQDPQAQIKAAVAKVTEKAGERTIAFVIRPDTGGLPASPGAVAAVREAVMGAMLEEKLAVVDSQPIAAQLRDENQAGNPPLPKMRELLTAAKADLLLSAAIRRTGGFYKITLVLGGADGAAAQQLVSIDAKTLTPGTDADGTADVEEIASATKSLTDIVGGPAEKLGQATAAAGIRNVYVAVQPESKGDMGTPGFECALFDILTTSLAAEGIESKSLAWVSGDGPDGHPMHVSGPLNPAAVARMRNLPAGSGVLVLSYTRHVAGRSLKLALVSTSAEIGTAAVGVDEWDAAAFGPVPLLNMGVVKFAEKHVGKRVGDGECWTLANEALISAGAKRADGYTFGRKLAKGEMILPGDIFQFTSVILKGHRVTMMLGMPNHTTVVRRVLGPTRYEIFQQNPDPVGTATIDFKDLKSGTWEAWRPQPR